MLRIESKQSSFRCLLYNKIPENHILKQIKKAVDFSFINALLENSYCKNFGRPAKEPELMCKLLFLEHIYVTRVCDTGTFCLSSSNRDTLKKTGGEIRNGKTSPG